jgi:predicted nucleotidyltransferase
MLDLTPYREAIGRVCGELRVRSLALVGSAARADFDPARSDVDLLVEFDGRDRLFDRYFDLKQQLERSLGRTVDLIEPAAVRNPIVQRNLQRRKVLLYGT